MKLMFSFWNFLPEGCLREVFDPEVEKKKEEQEKQTESKASEDDSESARKIREAIEKQTRLQKGEL